MNVRQLARLTCASPLLLVVAFDLYVIVFLVGNAASPSLQGADAGVPTDVTTRNFRAAWEQAGLGRLAVNSLVIVFLSVTLTLVASLGMAFALSRLMPSRRSRSFLRGSLIVLLAVPPTVLIVPIFYVVNHLGLINSFRGLVLVYAASLIPFCTFILSRYFDGLPVELFEAAQIDGAGALRQLRYVAIPNTMPGLVLVSSLSALTLWNELLFGLLIIQDPARRPLTAGVALLQSFFGNATAQETLSAAMVISIIPPLVLFALTSRRLVVGLTEGAVK